MLFSILVPVYNQKKYLSDCLDSILRQSFSDYEIVLIDDGSTDGSAEICDSYAERSGRIRLVHKKNGGLVSARKTGAEFARGDYILNVDSDDFIGEDYLQTLADALREAPTDLVAWGFTSANTKGCALHSETNECAPGVYTGDALQSVFSRFLFDTNRPAPNDGSLKYSIWTKAVKREFYCACQAQVPDEVVQGEDALLVLYLTSVCKSLQVLGYCGYYYRQLAGSMVRTTAIKDFYRQSVLMNAMNQYAAEKPEQKKAIDAYCFYRTFHLLLSFVKTNERYLPYRKAIGEVKKYALFGMADRIKNLKMRGKERIKFRMAERHLYSLLYIYFRYTIKRLA